MTSTRIPTIVDQLQAEEHDLQGRLDKLRQQAKSTESELSQVRKAIGTLKSRTPVADANHKPTATKEEILEITTELLQNGSRSEHDLKKLVEKRISSSGKALTGFAMRFKNVLKEERFVETGGKFQLSTELAAAQSSQT